VAGDAHPAGKIFAVEEGARVGCEERQHER
jgi:hypothetical protein